MKRDFSQFAISGLHLQDIPETFLEFFNKYGEAIERIEIRKPDGYHWEIAITYDSELYEVLREKRLWRAMHRVDKIDIEDEWETFEKNELADEFEQ